MRFIAVADLHLHPYRECSRDGGADRLDDGLSALRQTLAAARERGCPWVFLGDLKHLKDRWILSALNGALVLFEEFADVPKLLVAGNHDGVGGGRSGLEAFQALPNVRVVALPCVTDFPDLGVGKAAYWPHQLTLERLPALLTTARQAGVRVLFAHAFLSGAALGPDEVRLAKGASLEQFGLAGKNPIFDWAFLGDIHKAQMLVMERHIHTAAVGPGPVLTAFPGGLKSGVFYPGSPYSQNWGEREVDKGALYVDLDAGTVELVPVHAPRFRVVDFTGSSNAILEVFVAGTKLDDVELVTDWRGDFVRLIVGPWADGKLLKRVREASGARAFQVIVQRESRAEQRVDVHSGMDSRTLLSKYVEARPPGNGLDPKVVLAAGTRLLEGRNG